MSDCRIPTATRQIGTVELLATRIYTIDPDADVTDMEAASAVVHAGVYPVYREGDSTYWMLTGQQNLRGFESLGDGMFAIHPGDKAGDEQVSFPSKRFSPEEFAELLTDPVCMDGPARRLVFRLDVELAIDLDLLRNASTSDLAVCYLVLRKKLARALASAESAAQGNLGDPCSCESGKVIALQDLASFAAGQDEYLADQAKRGAS